MSECLAHEKLRLFAELARTLPGVGGKSVAPSTLHRWCSHGIATPTGDRVYLEYVFVGQRRATSAEALDRFLKRVTAAKAGAPAPVIEIRPSQSLLRAEAELERLGM